MGGGGPSNPLKNREFTASGGRDDDPLTRNLKKLYNEVADEPIPDDWMKLLEQMDAKAAAARPADKDRSDG